MKPIIRSFASCLCAPALLFAAGSASALTLNLGHTLAPESHYQVMAEKLGELVEQKSAGDITINTFPQSQLGGEVKMIQSARTGALDMFITAQAPLTSTVKAFSFFDVPYLFDGLDQANAALAGPLGTHFLDMLPKYNLVGLGWLSVMERNVFASRPVDGEQGMHGLKLRVMQSPGYVKTYESLGVQPTPMAYGELYIALQQGVIDGADTSPDQFVMDKFTEVSKFYSITRVHYLPGLLVVSKRRWDSLSDEQKGWLQEAADEALAYGIEYYKRSYDESIERMQANGVTVVRTDVAPLRERTTKVREQLIDQVPDGRKLFELLETSTQATQP